MILLRKEAHPKKWKLVSDGDLWEHLHKAICAKGVHSVRISWVKGHATQSHIDNGITTEVNKTGNHKADETADLGTALFGEDVMLAAKCLHKRHDVPKVHDRCQSSHS